MERGASRMGALRRAIGRAPAATAILAVVVPAVALGSPALAHAAASGPGHRPAAAAVSAGVARSFGARAFGARSFGARAGRSAATAQVTAHDGRLWVGSQPILLHGVNASTIDMPLMTDADYARIASWNMNFIRMRIHWTEFEPNPPTKNLDGTWTHDWDPNNKYASRLQSALAMASANGEYALIENTLSSDWPSWLSQAPYNSHGTTYTDQQQFNTDYWTDALLQRFTREWETYLANLVKPYPGVVGYEPLDEPNPGYLPETAANENLILNVELQLAQNIRATDPGRVIFFTTHDSLGAGLPHVDLSPWRSLGNVAYDVHDYFGGRWGNGKITDPTDPDYGEVMGTLLDFTLDPNTPPYLGTTITQMRFVQGYLDELAPTGIPLVIGEFGGREESEPNMVGLMGTDVSAFNNLNVSWAAWTYESMVKPDQTLEPWVPVLADAAAHTG